MAVVVEDEVGVEVAGLDWCAPIPGVVAFGILNVALGLLDRRLVAPSVGAQLVALESILPLFVVLVRASVGVVGDDEDPAMLCRRRTVGWEGERGVLEAKFHSRSRVRLDLTESSWVG